MWAFDRLPGSPVYLPGVFPWRDETSASESCASHSQAKPLLSPRQACVAVPQRTTASPPLRHISIPHKWRVCTHQPAQDLFVWEAKSSREFPPLALIEATNISLAGGKLPMTLKRAVAWTMLKKASRHIISIISYQSAFFLSCLLVIKVLRAGAAPKNWIPSARVLHPSLLPNCSSLPHPHGFVRPHQPDPGAPAILHFGPWTGQTAAKLNKGH